MNAIEGPPQGAPEPAVWDAPDMRAALAKRDFRIVYRLLQKVGYSQQRIAALTGQSQPEVSAIIHGRKVMALDVIERIVSGLGTPPAYVGLACHSCRDTACALAKPTPAGEHTGHDADPEVCDRLPRFATEDCPGATLSGALARPLPEHDVARISREILAAYARLQGDPAAWAAYQAELEEWDGLPRTTGELPTPIIGSAPGPGTATDETGDGCEM